MTKELKKYLITIKWTLVMSKISLKRLKEKYKDSVDSAIINAKLNQEKVKDFKDNIEQVYQNGKKRLEEDFNITVKPVQKKKPKDYDSYGINTLSDFYKEALMLGESEYGTSHIIGGDDIGRILVAALEKELLKSFQTST